MRTVCIIPARGGSKRIPRKNIRPFFGRPIIAYSIDIARQSRLFDEIIVSTEDAEISQVAQSCGASVLVRPAAMAQDEVGTQAVMQGAMRHVHCDMACCIYATAPMLDLATLWNGRAAILSRTHVYAMSVGTEPLRDAGAMYWGLRSAFLEGVPLLAPHTAMVPMPEYRVCDINTERDFSRAMMMYASLNGLEATA